MLKNGLKRLVICLLATPVVYLQSYNLDGFYLRAGLGYTWAHHPKATCSGTDRNESVQADPVKIAGAMPWVAGIGYQFNEHWRAEVSTSYRARVNYRLKNDAHEELKGRLSHLDAMANIFFDFSKLDTIIPYMGAGVGCAWNKTKKAKWASVSEGAHRVVAMTWMATVGLKEEISKGIWMDGAYRFSNLGKFRNSGCFDDGSYGASTKFKRYNANELIISFLFDI